VKSDKLAVQSAERAVQNTKLYAPEDGTIVSLTGQVGEVVSANGTTKASPTSSSSGGSGTGSSAGAAAGAAAALRSAGAAGGAAGSGPTGSSGSAGSAFAVLSDLSSLALVAPLSESEIGDVKDGQMATVSVEALQGRKLAAHVSEVALLSTTNSGVVSYDVTFHLDQMESGLRPGMSATAEVVVKQEEGVNVPTSAISGGAVTVIDNGKYVRRRVVTGLAGNSSTIILSGLNAGERVALPLAPTTGASGLRGIGGRGGLGGGLGGGLDGGGLGGGPGIFLRGG
jgi:multidrug efflux pump subunit AcrA (membrane-fusion protein)